MFHREHQRVTKTFQRPSLAKQSFKKETEINNIMSRYEKDGIITHVNRFQGNYGQFIGFEDYHSSMNSILAAKDAFADLPASIRKRFSNDAGVFLEFVQNPKNQEELVEMGLAHPKPVDPSKDQAGDLPKGKEASGAPDPSTASSDA